MERNRINNSHQTKQNNTMAKKLYDAVATIGEYKDRNGETKKRYINVGSVFENDKGSLSLKLDSVPVSPEWSGWISFYEPKERDQSQSRPVQNSLPPAPAAVVMDQSDDIPF